MSNAAPAKASRSIEVLEHDHSKALRKLRRLRQDIKGVKEYKTVDVARESIQQFVDFLDEVINEHFKQEEVALFPVMKQKLGEAYGPIDAMLDDHKQVVEAHGKMKAELKKEQPDMRELVAAAEVVLDVLEPHIDKEDEVIQPLALRLLSQEELEQVDLKAREVRSMN
ncbi:MAG: hemerythrin domain-containing protein [Bacillota bacterium]